MTVTDYRKNFWYILGLICTIGSILAMAASMVMMCLGMNIGIVIFFIACPILVFGILTAKTAKEHVAYAIETDQKTIPVFWHIKYAILVVGEFISRKGLWKFIFILLTVISLIVTLIFGAICGHYYLERQDIERNIDYLKIEELYNEKYQEWLEYKSANNEESAHLVFEKMQKYQSENAENKQQIGIYTEKLNGFKIYVLISSIVTIFFASVLAVYIIAARRDKKTV